MLHDLDELLAIQTRQDELCFRVAGETLTHRLLVARLLELDPAQLGEDMRSRWVERHSAEP